MSPSRLLYFCFALAVCLAATPAEPSSSLCKKETKSNYDLNTIGHRKLAQDFFSAESEKKLGDLYSSAFEKSNEILHDAEITAYVDRITAHIAQNSDANIPIKVEIVNSEYARAVTVPGGHQYIASSLILQLHNEGELASIIARGIAHTALRSYRRMLFFAILPGTSVGNFPMSVPCGANPNVSGAIAPFLLPSVCRKFEQEADFFAIQYLYKSGYDTDCFKGAIQRGLPPSRSPEALFSPFPPAPDRVKALQKEIDQILPQGGDTLVSTGEFQAFQERVRSLHSTKPPSPPKLIRHNNSSAS